MNDAVAKKPWRTPTVAEVDAAAIRAHVKMMHDLAKGCRGKLIVAGYGEDPARSWCRK
jgi:hypothetical protein